MNYVNDVIYLLKYDKEKNLFEVINQEVENIYKNCLNKYENDLLKKDKNYEYSVYDFEKMINTLNLFNPEIINSDKKKLNKAFCYNFDGYDDDKIIYFNYLKSYIKILETNSEVDKNELLNNFFSQIFLKYENKYFSKAIKGIIERCFYELEYLTRYLSFDAFEKDESICISSHKMKGFKSLCFSINNDLEIEVKTNFGFGKKSYLKVKIYYKNNQIISIDEFSSQDSQLVDNHLIQFKPEYNNWNSVLNYIKEISNLYLKNKNDFFSFLAKNLDNCIQYSEKIIDEEIIKVDSFFTIFFHRNDLRETLFYKITRISYIFSHLKNLLEENNKFISINIQIIKTNLLLKKLVAKLEKEVEIINKEILKIKLEQVILNEQNRGNFFSSLEYDLEVFIQKIEEFKYLK